VALSRRSRSNVSSSIWPGFVDAMTALLLVLMFVLTIFMIVQFVLRETITTQDTELNSLSRQVAKLAEALGLEQQKAFGLEGEVDRLDIELDDATTQAQVQTALIATLSQQTQRQAGQLTEFETQISSFEAQVASLLSERNTLSSRLEASTADVARELSQKEALQIALAQARDEVDLQVEQARLAAAEREALEAAIAQIQSDTAEKELSLQNALAALQSAEEQATGLSSSLASLRDRAAASDRQIELGNATEGELLDRVGRLEIALTESEKARLEEATRVAALQAQLEGVNTDLSDEEKARLAEAAAAEALRQRLADVETALTDEEKRRIAEAAAAEALRKKLEGSQTELTAMTLALEQQRKEAEDTLTLLAAARQAKDDVDEELVNALLSSKEFQNRMETLLAELEASRAESLSLESTLDATQGSLRQQLAAALAEIARAEQDAENALSNAQERDILLGQARELLSGEKTKSAEAERKLELLNQQTATLRSQLNALQSLLDAADARDTENQVQIEALGSNLNVALAQVAAEQKKRAEAEAARAALLEAKAESLEKFKSEFFGQLRDILGAQDGVQIVGDRFVFSSEVLFEPGATELSRDGEREIAKVATVIRSIAGQIPVGIDWILRVDGHTDNVPLGGSGKFSDNWELSQGRALSVVRYMIDFLGIPPSRLAATGFGEFQPVNPANTREARAQNRRIELKFTER
jgi:chemotaxis protein MotB